MLQYISRTLSQSRLPALSWLVNDLYQDAVSWGSPRDQVSLVKGGGTLARSAGARRDLPGGRCRWKTARSSAEERSAPNRISPWRQQAAHSRGDLHSPRSNLKVLSRRVGTNPRGNKGGMPVGCAVTQTSGTAFSSLWLLSCKAGHGRGFPLAPHWAT